MLKIFEKHIVVVYIPENKSFLFFKEISMTNNTIINKEIDVVHLHSESDLVLETNTQIRFSTSNILINYIPFDQYIRKIVFDEPYTSVIESDMNDNSWSESVNISDTSSLIDLNNNDGETIVNEIHTSGVSAKHSHIDSKHHYINISANNNIYFQNHTNSENIAFKKYTDSFSDQLTSLSNYVYKVLNGNFMMESGVHILPTITSGSHDVTTLGTYVGNKLTTTKLTTINVKDGANEPMLNFDSMTAVNMVSNANSGIDVGSNILFGSLSLDSLVKSQLDETGLLDLGVTLSSGQNIGISLDSFTNNGAGTVKDVFTYSVLFQLYIDSNPSIPLDLESLTPHPFQITKQITFPFTPDSFILGDATNAILSLDAGQFYTVVATFTNLRTNTVVENVILEPRSVATIEFITGLNVTIVDETKFNITFTGHATQVPGITVTFKVKIGWGSTTLIPYHNSRQTQNLDSESSKSIDFNLLTNDLNSSTNYGSRYVKNNTEHIFEIQSESSSFAIMNTPSFTLPAFTFSAPSYAPILSINYGSKQLTWTHTNNTADKLSIITFELFQGLTSKQDNTNTYYDITSLSIGTWKVWAKNVYGLSSGYSNEQKIVNPRFNIGSISANGNRKFNIGISSVNANGTHTLSGSYLTSTPSSSSITTNTLIPGTYTFTVTLTDQLNLSTNRTTSSTLSINDPSINSFGSFVNSGTLQFYVTVSVSNPNVSWSITSGNYSSVSGSNIYYTFPASDTGGAKSVSVTITDSYGYTASRTNNVNLSVSFAGGSTPSTSVSVSGTTISFTSDLASYKWYLNNSLISNTNSNPHEFIMSASHFGDIHCVATEENEQGFTRSITSDPTPNTQPTLSSKSFTGFDMSNDPPTVIFSAIPPTGISQVGSVVMSPATFSGAGTYTLKGTYENGYGLQKEITIGTFPATAPTNPSITFATNVSYDSMTINYNLGNNGNPSVTPTITLYYGTSSGSEDDSLTLTAGSTYENVTGLLVGTTYYFKINKVYQYYDTISSSDFDETTLDYQYDSEELVKLTLPSGGFLGMTDDDDGDKLFIGVYSFLGGNIRVYGAWSGYIRSVYMGDNRTYDQLQISIWDDPDDRILLEKGTGNNVFYIVFSGNYLKYDSSSSKLITSSTKDSTCEFIIEAFPFTYTDNKFQNEEYNTDYNKIYLTPTDDSRLFKSYYQAFSVKTKNEGHYAYRDQYNYLVVDTATNLTLKSQFLMHFRQSTFKDYQWFFFERQGFGIRLNGTEDTGFRLIENVKFPLSNLGKIHIVFEKIYVHINSTANFFDRINTGSSRNYNISYNTDIHIGPLHLNEVIVFHGDTWGINYFALYNIYEYVNEANESLGVFLTKANITNDSLDRIVIYLSKNTQDHWSSFLDGSGQGPNHKYWGSNTYYNDRNPYISIEVKNAGNTSIFTAYTNNFAAIQQSENNNIKRYNDTEEKRRSWSS